MKMEAIGRKIIKIIDSAVNYMILVIILLLIAFAGYTLWDSGQVHKTADKSNYEIYKPTAANQGKTFSELQSINPEVISWLTVFGTNIDYPVTQAANNKKYVNTGADGKYTLSGAIFLDCGNSSDFSDFNSILYGHHMAKKVMFGEIESFSQKSVFDSLRYANLYYNGEDHGIEFFAFVHADAYDTMVFTPNVQGNDRIEYLNGLLEKALHVRDIGTTENDRIILLSTCSSSSTNGRDILVGRITDEVYDVNTVLSSSGRGMNQTEPYNRYCEVTELPVMALLLILIIVIRMFIYIYAALNKLKRGSKTKERRKMFMDRRLKKRGAMTLLMAVIFIALFISNTPVVSSSNQHPKITVNQIIPYSDVTYTYILQPVEPEYLLSEEAISEEYVYVITGTGSKDIQLPDYNQPAVYKYKLFQIINEEKPGHRYDRRVYLIEMHVDESLYAEIIVLNEDGTKAEEIIFMIPYDELSTDPASMIDPPLIKTVSGNPASSDVFEFRLQAMDVSSPMPSGSSKGMKTIKITGSGESKFGIWSYDKEGVYYYKIYEINTGIYGYSYDTSVYTITDTVTEGEGELKLSRVVTNELNRPVTTLSFINSFNDGKYGPKTGDDMNAALYQIMMFSGCLLAAGAVAYLIFESNRKRTEVNI